MDKDEIGRNLRLLAEADGPSGREGRAIDVARTLLSGLADDVQIDAVGSLVAVRRGIAEPRKRVMIAAHLDEIGLIVTKIEDGFLHVSEVGGVDPRSWLGQEVTVYPTGPGSDQYGNGLRGYIGGRPPHLRRGPEGDAATTTREFRVDIGLHPNAPELELIRVGDFVTASHTYVELLEGRVASKALDNRAGVAAMIGALGYLAAARHDWDVVAVATAQEEMGYRGATTSAFEIAPDVAVAIDVTFGDTPGLDESKTVPMDKGPALGWGPNLHPGVVKALREAADALEIPYVTEPLPGRSGTDAWAIQVAREGIPTALLSIPVRYMHSPAEMVALADIDRTARLLAGFIARLGPDSLSRIAEEM